METIRLLLYAECSECYFRVKEASHNPIRELRSCAAVPPMKPYYLETLNALIIT
jgi:hypothetical protein